MTKLGLVLFEGALLGGDGGLFSKHLLRLVVVISKMSKSGRYN